MTIDPAILEQLNAADEPIHPEILAQLNEEPSAMSRVAGALSPTASTGGEIPWMGGAANMASSIVAKPISDVAGLAALGTDLVTGGAGDPAGFKQHVQESLTYTPRSQGGKDFAEYNPVSLIGQGIGTAANAIGDLVSDGDNTSWEGIMGNLLREAIPQAIAIYGGKKTSAIPARQADMQTKAGQMADRDATALAAKKMGFKVAPTSLNSSTKNRAIESLAGRKELHGNLAESNLDVASNFVRQDLGLPENIALSPETFKSVRREAGKAYEQVAQTGNVTLDPTFFKSLDDIEAKYTGAGTAFPNAKNPVKKSLDTLRYDKKGNLIGQANSAGIVDMISNLREAADGAYRSGKNALGKAQKQAANALEDLLDRHLQAKANASLPQSMQWASFFDDTISKFQNARKQIAKSYTYQSAMDGTKVSPAKLAQKHKKSPNLFEGDAATVAKFGQYFPEAVKPVTPTGIMSGGDALFDFGLGGGSAAAAGLLTANPYLAALAGIGLPAARHGTRAAIESPIGQGMIIPPSYTVNPVPSAATAVGGLSATAQREKMGSY